MFVRETCAAAVFINLTLWLQCGGIAALITWVRAIAADDLHRLGLIQVTILVVRLGIAVVVLHLLEVLVWAAFYRWFCLPSWSAALYFSAGSYGNGWLQRFKPPAELAHLWTAGSIIGVLMCGMSVSLLFATATRLINLHDSRASSADGHRANAALGERTPHAAKQ